MLTTINSADPNPKWEDYDFDEEFDTPVGKLKIVKVQPYGFRQLVLENGVIPERYAGNYTSLDHARTVKDQLIEELKHAKEDNRGRTQRSAIQGKSAIQ